MAKKSPRQEQLEQMQRDSVEKLKACQKELERIETIVLQLSPLLGAFEQLASAMQSIRRAIFCLDDSGESEYILERGAAKPSYYNPAKRS